MQDLFNFFSSSDPFYNHVFFLVSNISSSQLSINQVGNWLERDSDYQTEAPASYQERINAFRNAYVTQSTLRQEAESRLMTIVGNRMDSQDRALKGSTFSNIQEYEE